MAVFKVETKNKVDIDKKPRVYFTCHPDDFEKHFKKICDDIFKTHDCAIYYTEDMTEIIADDEKEIDLGRNNLFVVPVTYKLLSTPNRAMNEDIPYALEMHIPVLPIMMDAGIDSYYSNKFRELQYLNPYSTDITEISYEEKLKKYLESVLVSKELSDRIRKAFDAYIFLSYRKKDRKYANELMRLIHSIPECRDIAIWFDEFLTPGESFKENIEKILDDSQLFTLLVTPHILEKVIDEKGIEKDNFVIEVELPLAQKKKEEKAKQGKSGGDIVSVKAEDINETDEKTLKDKDVTEIMDARSVDAFKKLFLEAIIRNGIRKTEDNPKHNFLIGLAYLEGIDVEVNRELAVELITEAAESNLPEAIAKLISMYIDGIGVSRNQSETQKWSDRLAGYYFQHIFSKKGIIKSKKKITELFSKYKDNYWRETISAFLVKADKYLSLDTIKALYEIIMSFGICEYTLLFETCKDMTQHQEETQNMLIADILTKSVNGTYPPYGPLFWYIPEYKLYDGLLMTLDTLKSSSNFTKMLVLVRDVCWIFGHYNTVTEITNHVCGELLFLNANVCGIRRGLCELFFTGKTFETCGNDIYPRCFNLAEAKNWKEHGCGVLGRMSIAFDDELGLYSHEMFSELGGEYIGIVSAPYNKDYIETVLPQKSCKKLCGLFLVPTKKNTFDYMAINDTHIRVCYIPENITNFYQKCSYTIARILDEQIVYFYDNLYIPDGVIGISASTFKDCTSIISVTLPDSIKDISISAFENCSSLSTITMSRNLIRIAKDAFSNCTSLTSIIIPDSVTKIGSGAFCDCTSLQSVELSKNLTSIGNLAFCRCAALSSIVLPNKLVEIGSCIFQDCTSLASATLSNKLNWISTSMFENCTSLTSIHIPESVKTIGYQAFSGCTALSSITISNNVEDIRPGAFCNCISLKSIILPESIKIIYDEAFKNCSSLISINIPELVTEIGEAAFCDCTSLVSINIPKEILFINDKTFSNCRSLTTVSFAEGLRSIFHNAFSGCKSLSTIRFPDSLDSITDCAFSDCISLLSISLPNTIKYIGKTPFEGCRNLKQVSGCPENLSAEDLGVLPDCDIFYRHNDTPPKKNEIRVATVSGEKEEIYKKQFVGYYELQEVYVLNGVTKINEEAFYNCTSLKTIVLPEGITEIGAKAFEKCTSLVSITLPNSVKKICRDAFFGCTSLEKIILSQDLVEIGDCAFYDCTSLTSVIIPQGVKYIGERIFENCSSLTSIILPDSILTLGTSMFKNCTSLKSLTIPEGIESISWHAFENCKSLNSIILPLSVKDICGEAFKGCCSLVSIDMQNGVESIEMCAFEGCSSLTSITIPETATQIGLFAFSNCISLKEVTVLGDVNVISHSTFYNCSSLEKITFSHNITTIEKNAFSGCVSLSSIQMPGDIQKIESGAFENCSSITSIALSDSIAKIEPSIFDGCAALTSVIIPSNVRIINSAAFRDCVSLTSVSLPEHLKTIDWCAFENCTSLTTITIPGCVKKVGWNAFKNCVSLISIDIPTSVRIIEDNAFEGCIELKELTISRRFEDELPRIFNNIDLSQLAINWE